jgi:L-asparaginase
MFLALFVRAQEKPLVWILSTGGTIASQFDEEQGGLVPALTGEDMVKAVPELADHARIRVEQVSNIGSPDMTPEIWLKLARRANEVLAGPDVAGVVVTHGTDTLEETAYFLDLAVTVEKPVIMVGAQRAPSYGDTDGPRNLLNAVRVAVSPEARGMGTLVVMNGQINAAREVTKTSTIARETFQTLEFGALGVANLGGVRFYRAPLRRQTIAVDDERELPTVEIVPHYAGADGRMIRSLLDDGKPLQGLVIAATGLGHVNPSMHDAIVEVLMRDIPVVISTRVYTGRLMPLYAGKGRGVALKEAGCIFADNLSPQKARILLMLALTETNDPSELQVVFDR